MSFEENQYTINTQPIVNEKYWFRIKLVVNKNRFRSSAELNVISVPFFKDLCKSLGMKLYCYSSFIVILIY